MHCLGNLVQRTIVKTQMNAKVLVDTTVGKQPESQNFLDPGLAKYQSYLNLWFKNTDLG